MNQTKTISGTTFSLQSFTDVGFRFDTRTSRTTLLYPVAGDPDAWALGINNRGDILGYSFVFGATERIGVWDNRGVFTPYFVEGTPQIPTVSNKLVFNDNNVTFLLASPPATSYRHLVCDWIWQVWWKICLPGKI